MKYSEVKISDLVDIDDLDMMKVIFSSGDYFPGFYRYTLGTQRVGDESLGLNTLIWMYFEQKMTGKKHHKEYWLDLQHEIHDRDVASETARNARNFPSVRNKFSEKMMDWYFKGNGFDIAYQDIYSKVECFERDTTYYFMGSLIRYHNEKLHIGYNQFQSSSALELDVGFDKVQEYLNEIFSPKQLGDLFLYADIVAQLKFGADDLGELVFNEDTLDALLLKNSDIKVFGAPFHSQNLPMRFAKCIRFTNFKRGESGEFEAWQSDQNW
ncbi:MAG: hypothetical protein VYA54_08935 [Bdellovibrionota bacterium]|nr:hypothetical protein [Bdellovibrionota bacterium]